ncbi:helix-turn-helix domain-containing protein [Allofournierella sp.]|uniref:helix-turn-helix domain-containing protein n=1 Tax=Allofournierella sp. TaxID=1940256 RepID=UPI003AF1C799
MIGSDHRPKFAALAKEKVVSESTMQKLRTGGALSTDTIDTLCRIIGCQPGDIMEYIPDN